MPQAQTITVRARGLYDPGNNPWTLPSGALFDAMNLEMIRKDILTPRRGMEDITVSSPSRFYAFGGQVIGVYNSGAFPTGTATVAKSSDLGSTWTSFSGTWGSVNRAVVSAQTLFMAGGTGVLALDSISGSIALAGLPPGLDVSAAVAGAGTAVPNNTRVAYRVVFGKRDANNRLLLSTPSSRIVLTNTAGATQNVTLVMTLPTEVQSSSYFVQVYRTLASVDQNTDPGDECYLVYEQILSAVSTLTVTDSTPDGLGGASLYTNPSQETILGGNTRPPLAYDLAEFGGSLWYADVTFPARRTIYLLGVSGTNGLAINDTITVNGQVFTAKAAENVAAREFLLSATGVADTDVRATTASLIKCINRTSAALAYAIDISEPYPSGIPGAISITRTDLTGTLTLAVLDPSCWSGVVANTSPVRNQNGVVFSKPGQPDAIQTALAEAPILVGSADKPVSRIVATRNALWVLKEDGVWRVTGSAGQFDVQPFDPTIVIIAPRSAVSLNNQVYFLSDQGVARVSESGVEVVSDPIRDYFIGPTITHYALSGSIAVAHEERGLYTIWPNTLTGVGLVFNLNNSAWTYRVEPRISLGNDAFIDATSGRMLISQGTHLLRERSLGLNGCIYADASAVTSGNTVSAVSSGVYSISGPVVAASSVNDIVTQGILAAGRVTENTGAAVTVVASSGSFSTGGGDITVWGGIPVAIGHIVASSSVGTSNEWIESDWLFGTSDAVAVSGTVDFVTDGGTSSVATSRVRSGITNMGSTFVSTLVSSTTDRFGSMRVTPGRESSLGQTLYARLYEKAAYIRQPDTFAGLIVKFYPQGDQVGR